MSKHEHGLSKLTWKSMYTIVVPFSHPQTKENGLRGSQTTDNTGLSNSILLSILPLSTFQMTRSRSSPPLARNLPFGENERQLIESVCPFSRVHDSK